MSSLHPKTSQNIQPLDIYPGYPAGTPAPLICLNLINLLISSYTRILHLFNLMSSLTEFQKKRLGLWLITFAAIEYFFALIDNATLLTFFLIFFPAILIILLPKIKFIVY